MVGSCDPGELSYTTLTVGKAEDATLAAGFTWERFQFTTGAAGAYRLAFTNVTSTTMRFGWYLFNNRAAADVVASTSNHTEFTSARIMALTNDFLVQSLEASFPEVVFNSDTEALSASTTYFLLIRALEEKPAGGSYTITVSGP